MGGALKGTFAAAATAVMLQTTAVAAPVTTVTSIPATSSNLSNPAQAEEQRIRQTYNLPADTNVLVKPAENAPGQFVYLYVSDRAAQELGGLENLRRIFEMTVQKKNQIVLFTQDEMAYAASYQFRRSGESRQEGQSRYLDEHFGGALSNNENSFYGWMDNPGKKIFWDELLTKQKNQNALQDSTNFINIDQAEFVNGWDLLKGNNQQAVNFLLGHEIKHSDNRDLPFFLGETDSDQAGIKAMELVQGPGAVDSKTFTDSLIAQRVSDSIHQQLGHYYYPVMFENVEDVIAADLQSTDHDTGFFLDPGQPGQADINAQAGKGLSDFKDTLDQKLAPQLLPDLAQNIDLSSTSGLAMKGSWIEANYTYPVLKELLDMSVDGNEEPADGLDPAKIMKYQKIMQDIETSTDSVAEINSKKAELVKSVAQDMPQLLDFSFSIMVMKDGGMMEEPYMSAEKAAPYQQEIQYLEDGDPHNYMTDIHDCVQRMIAENPEAYKNYMIDHYPAIVMADIEDKNPGAVEGAIDNAMYKLYRDNTFEDPQIARAVKIYLQARDILPPDGVIPSNQASVPASAPKPGA